MLTRKTLPDSNHNSGSGCPDRPLAGLDLNNLFAALNRYTILMHGADYDVRLFKLGHDFVPNRIFDTMLAARLTGRTSFGLSHLCQEFLGVELEKTSQKANWAQRPLTEKMEEYARNDTRHLRPLVEALRGELQAKGRLDWHAQECDRLVRDNSGLREVDPDQVWRIKGSARLSRELWQCYANYGIGGRRRCAAETALFSSSRRTP